VPLVAGDAGRVTGERQERPDPEVPEKARRPTFTRIGTRAACAASGVPQATWYRRHRISPPPPKPALVPHAERVQPRALAPAERAAILDALHSDRFAGTAPAEAWATLLDEGIYLGSVSTFYRVLRAAGESRDAAGRLRIRPRSSPSWQPPARTRSTPGTSPSCTARRNGPTTTST
jgi:hypothetical protein